MSTATFSPIVPEMKMNGISARNSRAIASAERPLNCGIEKSEMTRWGRNSWSSRRKSGSVCTRRLWKSSPPRVNSRRTSSASFRLSSASKILSCSAMLSAVSASDRASHGRRLVDDGPEHACLFYGVDKLLKADWLDDVSIDAQLIAFHEIGFFARRSQHHDRDDFERLIALYLLQHFQPVHFGHLQIEKYRDRKPVLTVPEVSPPVKVIERLRAVAGDHDLVCEIVSLQGDEDQFDVLQIVLGEKNRSQVRHELSPFGVGEREIESRALVDLRLGPRPASVAGDDSPYIGEPHACALEFFRPMQPLEHSEQFLGVFHVETRSIVPHVKLQFAALSPAPDFDFRQVARTRILDRIREQVGPDLFQHRKIPAHIGQGLDVPFDVPAVGVAGQFLQHLFHQLGHADPDLTHLDEPHLGKQEQVVYPAAHLFHRL